MTFPAQLRHVPLLVARCRLLIASPLPLSAPACVSRRYPRNATAAATAPATAGTTYPASRPGRVDHPAGHRRAERHPDREPGAHPGHALGQLARVVRALRSRAIVVIIVGAMDRPATKSATARNGRFPTSWRGIILTAIAQTPSSHRRAGRALEVQQPEDRARQAGAQRVHRQHQARRGLVALLLGEGHGHHVDRAEDRAGRHEGGHQHLQSGGAQRRAAGVLLARMRHRLGGALRGQPEDADAPGSRRRAAGPPPGTRRWTARWR